MDTLVFDIETQNFFTDEGVGWNNYSALRVSVVGAYSYSAERYLCFEESETKEIAALFRGAARLVGFSINRYDVPVLNEYFLRAGEKGLDLWNKERIDMLEDIEKATGHRISLDNLAQANLGSGKTGHGAKAIELYREGKIKELKEYCLQDVRLTKELYDMYRDRKYFFIPNRESGTMEKVVVNARLF